MRCLPELTINEELPILICPDILQSSQITISKISLFNTLDSNQVLAADQELMHFGYSEPDSILGIPSSQTQIYKDDNFLSVIIQSNFSQNLSAVTERYARNMIFQEADLKKVYYSKVTKRENDNIDAISEKQASLALSSAHLLKSLLLKNFGGSPKDLQQIQKHDLKLNKIMDKVKAGSSKEFVIINKILYKKCQTPDVFLLCIP